MDIVRHAVTLATLGVLASQPFVPLARSLDAPPAPPEEQPAPPGPSAVQAPRLNQERLIAALRSRIPIEPVTLKGDPYLMWHDKPPPRSPADTVCGVRFERDQIHYQLATFANTVAAHTAGFAVTHYGACGTCSSLQDLAVYLEKPDLTAPVRKCGIRWGASARLRCLESLGFSTACAQTWLYDLQNTRRQCLSVCVWSWMKNEAPTQENGRLNACLQCDEDRSGPIFKATAGRTRRNSGIHSSIPRPEADIAPVVHDYVPDVAPR